MTIVITDNADGGKTTEITTGEEGDVTDSNLTVNYKSTETVDAEGEVISGASSYDVVNEDSTYRAEGGDKTEKRTEEAPQLLADSSTWCPMRGHPRCSSRRFPGPGAEPHGQGAAASGYAAWQGTWLQVGLPKAQVPWAGLGRVACLGQGGWKGAPGH